MIVVDSSAIIAILFDEPSADTLAARLSLDPDRVLSAVSYLEVGAVLAGRVNDNRHQVISDLDAFLVEARITIAQVDAEQARIALNARITYGRGMGHGGVLNLGDAFSYALAKSLDAPLLYIGNDFGTTDIKSAFVSERQ
ncbi:MAG: PIN domain-containing protein [Thiobacillus sp.]|nr:PIN domain-containing protein [Thiobacillus sp.]